MNEQPKIPFYRDVRYVQTIAQLLFVIGVVVVGGILLNNLFHGLAQKGLNLSFEFLKQPSSFDIAEGTERTHYETGVSSYLKAFGVGLYNTLRVSGIGIVLATLLGVLIGILRLSSNWLVNRLAFGYVEIIRNTPLLVQIVFWYYGVLLTLPDLKSALKFGSNTYLSGRGFWIPWYLPSERFMDFLPFLIIAIVVGIWAWIALERYRVREGKVIPAGWIGVGSFLLITLLGRLIAGSPFNISVPSPTTYSLVGGAHLSPEFLALLIALVIYTSGFIAEIVRSGIQAIPRGQWEAARSVGLSYAQSMQLIILPQTLKIIVPPMGNQYLNLMKNSSLAVAIGYPDLFNVSNTTGNQSGNNVQAMILVLGVYLFLSLMVSFFVNLANRRAQRGVR